ncbi:helix-turn-helix transcriptional regulator [Crossiella sp. SN42]|uniref:Scr1 family TA system antitoxin-like transcriptional regulator n=1 Tax=Crossiella sp. SN42 TaxID=2944808 RepID=UPI00207C5717|nr:helix-turn-helix transcriptional regulator [Crossiella sp. SN42]MCO1575850.1 helix-turn-helix transcriptional regulator [Crossiella sp. SN42]
MAAVRTAKKLVLGQEIKHMIETAGVTQAVAGSYIEIGQSKVSGLIRGEGSITVGDLERLATKLGFTDPNYIATLLELRRDNHKRGWWDTGYRRAYHEDIRLLVDVEGCADRIRSAEVEILPGLGQSRRYVEALHEGSGTEPGGPTFEDYVTARLARQEIFERANPPEVHWVLSESCLRRMRCDAADMAEAIRYLVTLSKRPNVFVQVLPFNLVPGKRSPIGNRFTLLRLPSPGQAGPIELAYTEGEGRISYLDDKDALKAHDESWTRLSAAALDFVESRKFMEKVAEAFEEVA